MYLQFIHKNLQKPNSHCAHKKEHLETNNSSNIIQAYKHTEFDTYLCYFFSWICTYSIFIQLWLKIKIKKEKKKKPIFPSTRKGNTTVKHQRNTTAFQKIWGIKEETLHQTSEGEYWEGGEKRRSCHSSWRRRREQQEAAKWPNRKLWFRSFGPFLWCVYVGRWRFSFRKYVEDNMYTVWIYR